MRKLADQGSRQSNHGNDQGEAQHHRRYRSPTGAVFGTSNEFRMNLQSKYDIDVAQDSVSIANVTESQWELR